MEKKIKKYLENMTKIPNKQFKFEKDIENE